MFHVPTSLIGSIGLVGIFLRAGSHTYWRLCVSAVECRAGTSVFGCFAGLGGGPVRVFLATWLSFGVCLCDLTGGGVAGQYDFSSIFCFILAGQYD